MNLHNMPQQHQHQTSNPKGLQTAFWTICPACGMRYQYYLSILKKAFCCQNCLKPFSAHDLKDQGIPSGTNQRSAGVWKNAGAPQNFTGPQSNGTGQKGWSATLGVHVNIGSYHANVNTKRETDGNAGGLKNKMKSARATRNPSKAPTAGLKRGRRVAFESSESSISETSSDSEEEVLKHGLSENSTGPAQQTRRSSRQKQEVRCNEDSDDGDVEDDDNTVEDDFVGSPALKRLRSGLVHGDYCTKTAKLNEGTAGRNGLSNCSNIKDTKNSGTPCEEKTSDGVEHMKRETMHARENSDGKEEAFPSANPECSSVRSQDRDSKHAGLSSGDRKGSMNVGQGQHTKSVNAGIPAKTPEEEKIKHNTHLPEVTDVDADDDNICQTVYVCAESEFFDFSEIRLLQRFSHGQIWALYSDIDKFPKYYAFIQKVDLKNDEVQVRWLDVCPHGEVVKRLSQEERTIGIGAFRLSNVHEMMTYTGTDAFSHRVEARYAGRKGEYEILPRLGEIWAVYKNWGAGWTAQDFENCEYELVEILCRTDSSIQVQLLRKVDGYKMVFMSYRAEGSVMTIRKDEYPKFSHQIPCFRFTHEKGGKLRGYLELDPLSLPEKFLY